MDADDGGVGESVGEAVEDGVLSFSVFVEREGGREGGGERLDDLAMCLCDA